MQTILTGRRIGSSSRGDWVAFLLIDTLEVLRVRILNNRSNGLDDEQWWCDVDLPSKKNLSLYLVKCDEVCLQVGNLTRSFVCVSLVGRKRTSGFSHEKHWKKNLREWSQNASQFSGICMNQDSPGKNQLISIFWYSRERAEEAWGRKRRRSVWT